MQDFDVIIIGAGAAGLFCAGLAGQRGLSVLLLDHAPKVAEKIRISGGGRANFTNRDLDPAAPQRHYLGANPQFCRSALSRYTPTDFTALVQRHGIAFHEKHRGQLFCDGPAQQLIDMLLAECRTGGVTHWQPCAVRAVEFLPAESPAGPGGAPAGCYRIDSSRGTVRAPQLVVATGGLSVPKIGATDFAWRIAAQFGLPVQPPRPALVPLTFDAAAWQPWAQLAGLALPVRIATGDKKARMAFDEDLLFTHRGLSGPAVLQISGYWRPGSDIAIDLAPGADIASALAAAKPRSRRLLANELAALLPARLADRLMQDEAALQRPLPEVPDRALAALAARVHGWAVRPTGTEGWAKAEVTAGGVDTRALSQQTLEARAQPGLFFIGEAVDITGWLGGYNFQWAWASAHACAHALGAPL